MPGAFRRAVKTEIRATMDAYADAAQVWRMEIESSSNLLDKDEEPGRTDIPKYSLTTTVLDSAARLFSDGQFRGGEFAEADKAMQVIWFNASLHLNKLADLLDRSKNS